MLLPSQGCTLTVWQLAWREAPTAAIRLAGRMTPLCAPHLGRRERPMYTIVTLG